MDKWFWIEPGPTVVPQHREAYGAASVLEAVECPFCFGGEDITGMQRSFTVHQIPIVDFFQPCTAVANENLAETMHCLNELEATVTPVLCQPCKTSTCCINRRPPGTMIGLNLIKLRQHQK